MLIEMSSMAQPPAADPASSRRPAEIAAHDARTARIDRALDAIDDLARRRRTQELVEAVERLGAGLHSTMDALDDTIDAAVDAVVPLAWRPISTPVVPITAFVAAPAPAAAPAARQIAAAAPAAQDLPEADVAPADDISTEPHPEAPAAVAHAVRPPAVRPAHVDEPVAPVADVAPTPRPRVEAPAGLAAFVIPAPDATA